VYKKIIESSLNFLVENKRVRIFGFVFMNNHIHLLWRIQDEHNREDVQRDFLRFTSQQMLKVLRNTDQDVMIEFFVGARDRKFQVWERNSLSTEIWNERVFIQKLEYIHNNPVRAKLCELPEQYFYSSAKFYLNGENDFEFLEHYKG
jgi:REP element-mobilizing transposase RayT